MKKLILLIVLAIASTASAHALSKDSVRVDQDVFTNLYFRATNGAKWPVYKTPSGEFYAVRTSRFTKKGYRYNIPKAAIQ